MRGKPEAAAPYVVLASEAPFASERDVPFGQGLVTLVGGLVLLGKGSVAESVLDRAERAAATSSEGDPVFEAFLASARCALISVAPVKGRWRLEEAFHGGREAAAALGKLGAIHGESIALYYFAIAAMHLGRYENARDATLRSLELTRRASSGVNEEWSRLFLAKAYLRLGKPEEALAAVAPFESSPDWTVRQMLPVIVAEARLRQGDYAAAVEEAAPACAGVSPRLSRLAACVMASAQLLQGKATEALATITFALERCPSSGFESDIDLYTLRAQALRGCERQVESLVAIGRAKDLVLGIAANIGDLALKASFLDNVEPCARALRLYEEWSAAEAND
jgi:tetratricopeptide (TPR) repeat protein